MQSRATQLPAAMAVTAADGRVGRARDSFLEDVVVLLMWCQESGMFTSTHPEEGMAAASLTLVHPHRLSGFSSCSAFV